MAINHKFIETDFGHGLTTKNAILSLENVLPECLFLGTFNPNTTSEGSAKISNPADFFYGRNWFWPALFNIVELKRFHHTKQRKYSSPFEPSLENILRFCNQYRIAFADLIEQVFPSESNNEVIKNSVIKNGEVYNLIKDNDLADLDRQGEVVWTTQYVIEYLKVNKAIKVVYFTRNAFSPFLEHWNKIKTQNYDRNISFRQIFTPSGQGLSGRPRICQLMKRWLCEPGQNYQTLDLNWLKGLGIDIDALCQKECS